MRVAGKISILVCAGAAIILGACATDECEENRNSLPLAGFYDSASGEQVVLSRLTLYGLHAPGDSMLLQEETNVEEAYLPFRISQRSTTFVLDYIAPAVSDTVTFSYEPVPRFVSSECGAVYDFNMTRITCTHHVLDSVTCPEGVITNVPGQNLRFYLRTS